jgi:RNA polymerase sigma-70 factor (ECF subfamily)
VLIEQSGRISRMAGLTDADLIERSRSDPGCFAAIFDRHADEILRYAHARLGPDLAEDVTAETFLAAFRHRDRYDTTRPDARPWLYGIAVRQIGRHRRALARRLKLLRAAPTDLVTEDVGHRAAERVTAEQLRPQLSAVLSGLPRHDRELLLLVAWAGLSYEESAQARETSGCARKMPSSTTLDAGIPAPTSSTHLGRSTRFSRSRPRPTYGRPRTTGSWASPSTRPPCPREARSCCKSTSRRHRR